MGVSLNKAHMALEIRISDVASSAVIATGRVKGEASDVSGNFAAGIFANGGFTAGLSAYANTPMEKAIRVCLVEAVRYLTQAIPESYYKY